MIRNALLSVYDKTGIVDFARRLVKMGTTIWSSGGTAKVLNDAGIPHSTVEDLTGFPHLFGGRVKTLHPKVHGGILMRESEEDKAQAGLHGIPPIDLVAVNLYPFEEYERDYQEGRATYEEVIENIDIGGPTLLRSAAKNYERVYVLSDPSAYEGFFEAWTKAEPLIYRKVLAAETFRRVTFYDMAISHFFDPRRRYREDTDIMLLKYGSNPSQTPAYVSYPSSLDKGATPASQFRLHNGRPSYINMLDGLLGAGLVKDATRVFAYEDGPLYFAASYKHNSPAGFAVSKISLADAYKKARDCDPLSSFGDFVAVSHAADEDLALTVKPEVSDGIMAPEFGEEALSILKAKKKGTYVMMAYHPWMYDDEMRDLCGLTLHQPSHEDFEALEDLDLEEGPLTDLRLATICLKYTQSNSVVIAYGGQCIGIGAGQQNRVDCVRLAVRKAHEFLLRKHPKVLHALDTSSGSRTANANLAYDLVRDTEFLSVDERKTWLDTYKGKLSLSSDGFFPFPDSIDVAYEGGVGFIVQPGGSTRDGEVEAKAKELGIVLHHTGRRYFTH